MSADDSWTDEQRERIAAFCDSKDADALVDGSLHGQTSNPISIAQCREWRTTLRDDPDRPASTLPGPRSQSTKRQHAHSRCGHDPAVVGEPADPREDWDRRGGI